MQLAGVKAGSQLVQVLHRQTSEASVQGVNMSVPCVAGPYSSLMQRKPCMCGARDSNEAVLSWPSTG